MKYLLLISLIFACGPKEEYEEQTPQPTPVEKLVISFDNQKAKFESERDKDGWIGCEFFGEPAGCDLMLWVGKYNAVVCEVNMRAAQLETGKHYRNPSKKGCSHSWSRDMGLGFYESALACGDLEILKEHSRYARDHIFKMGDPLWDLRVVYSPNMIGLMFRIIDALGGPFHGYWALMPKDFATDLSDYEGHLVMLRVRLESKIDDGLVDEEMKEAIDYYATAEPNCPFYEFLRAKYDDGDYSRVVDLLNESDGELECSYLRGQLTHDVEKFWMTNMVLNELGY